MITTLVHIPLIPPVGPPRSEGVHLSKVIRAMALESKILDEKWGKDLSLEEISSHGSGWWEALDEDSKVRMAIGMAWEDWYMAQIPNVAYHPGEMELDGIFMTHDGESIDFLYGPRAGQIELACHEVKTTSKSLRHINNLHGEWMWIAQCKGYAKALGCRVVYLHVLFLFGDYSRPFKPQRRCWRIEFTQAEIDTHWEDMTDYVRYRLSQDREDEGLEGGV